MVALSGTLSRSVVLLSNLCGRACMAFFVSPEVSLCWICMCVLLQHRDLENGDPFCWLAGVESIW
jgi:hypothetical protein